MDVDAEVDDEDQLGNATEGECADLESRGRRCTSRKEVLDQLSAGRGSVA